MRAYVGLVIAAGILLSGCVTGGLGTTNSVIRAKMKVAPALVHVRPVKEVFRRGERREVSLIGSGFIISPDGYVVTNEHVAGNSNYVRCVLFDKDEVEAEVVGTDSYTDIAILKLITDRTDLPYVKLGRSSTLKAGQTVLALGSPHGLARSVSLGIVSVTDRNLEALGAKRAPYNNWIQTDAAINPGNSGGPLVNLRGEVVGINTRKLSGADNVGFAIPIDIAKEVIAAIIEHGSVTRSTIGVAFQEMMRFTDDSARKGVLIGDVDPLSPTYAARIRPGDILLAIDGAPTNARFIEDLPAVRKLVADLPVGEPVELTILRGDEELYVTVRTVEKSELEGDQNEFSEWGCTISELTPDVIRRGQLTSKQGVVVSGIQAGGLAYNAELLQGDIILEVDEEDVVDLEDFERRYAALIEDEARLVLLTVKRAQLTLFILVEQSASDDDDASDAEEGRASDE
ncbi:MAG: trypsin-like peptidase domain-containing protein [Candidatus Hydrogenedentes bacterium]|nr:trypsin-like peptidase domain-containing protein [Candidatus Hydrogenedentota bacterium]